MPDETAITADDWGAAMSEQATAEATAGADDWAAAMAEQEAQMLAEWRASGLPDIKGPVA